LTAHWISSKVFNPLDQLDFHIKTLKTCSKAREISQSTNFAILHKLLLKKNEVWTAKLDDVQR